LLDDPISVLIVSESAAGKSLMMETVKKLMPPEDVVSVTSLSDQALNYFESLSHKYLILGEDVHSDVIEHQIREMLSGKELSRLVTLKDEKTGKMKSTIFKTPAVVASVMGSTRQEVNPENASRCFIMNVDESTEQTARIHEAQRKKYSLDRYLEKRGIIPEIIKKHQIAQRLLKKRLIINPFGKYLNFPSRLMRTRRDNERFLDLIACICFLRQYQKELIRESGLELIECDLEDYRIAYDIMVNGILASTIGEIPQQAAFLYEETRKLLKEKAKKEGLKTEEVSVSQREIRERTGLNQMFVKRYLRILAEFEYIRVRGFQGRGATASYLLASDAELERMDLSIIPTPEGMALRLDSKSGSVEEKNV
jgi:hypothetical protein